MSLETDLPDWFEYVKPNFSLLPDDTPLLVLQVGAYKGNCTEYLLDNHQINKIVDVDTWEGSMKHPDMGINFNSVEKIYDQKFIGDQRVVKVKTTSDLYFANSYTKESFDFVY